MEDKNLRGSPARRKPLPTRSRGEGHNPPEADDDGGGEESNNENSESGSGGSRASSSTKQDVMSGGGVVVNFTPSSGQSPQEMCTGILRRTGTSSSTSAIAALLSSTPPYFSSTTGLGLPFTEGSAGGNSTSTFGLGLRPSESSGGGGGTSRRTTPKLSTLSMSALHKGSGGGGGGDRGRVDSYFQCFPENRGGDDEKSSSSSSNSEVLPSPNIDPEAGAQLDLPQNRIRRSNVFEAWQSSKSCLKERLSYLFNSETLSDITFIVGKERVAIPGHKFVLAIGSPVFDAMFNGPLSLGDSEKSVTLPDIEPEAFLGLLKFLYSDEVTVSPETVLTVLYTAKKYAVNTLEEHCVAFLKDNLTAENSFLLLSQARLFDEPQLASLCLDCIDKNTTASIAADGFPEVDLDTLCAVLERDTLRIKELCLYQAVLRWASHECSRRGLGVTPQNQRFVLGRGTHLIRFTLIPVEDFSIYVAQPQNSLLSDSELIKLFLNFNIGKSNSHLRPAIDFIDRPRCYMTGKQLSVYRFQQVETRWGYNGLSDQIRFTSDRRVYIVGFGLYGGLFGSKDYRVDIQISQTIPGTLLGHHTESFTSDGSKSTFKVMFVEPIEILQEILYTASATMRGPDSYYGAKGQRKVSVECPDGSMVNFTFSYSSDNNNGTSVEDGQIPEIIFHT